MKKHKTKSAKLGLLKVRDLITSRTNQYNDYYDKQSDYHAGQNKHRPCLILDIYEEKYYLVTFATSQFQSVKVKNKKILRKGSQTIVYKNHEFYFNPTTTFIFNRQIMWKNMKHYLGNVPNDQKFRSLLEKSLEVGQIWNENDPHLLLDIIDSIINKQFSIADMLIEKQFPDPTNEDIVKRHKIIEEHNEFLKKKKEKS